MSKQKKSPSTPTTSAALAALREFWLSDGLLTPENEDQAFLAKKKLWADFDEFCQRARTNPAQWQQLKKLKRFYREAKYGPALSTSWKRIRAAGLLKCYRRLALLSQPIEGLPPLRFDSSKYLKPILEAARTDNDRFWSDFEIAAKFTKNQSHVNCFLAEYSLLMLGKRPLLTFGELRKILHWEAANLRRRIKHLRKRYGPEAVPLKPGVPGRPVIIKSV